MAIVSNLFHQSKLVATFVLIHVNKNLSSFLRKSRRCFRFQNPRRNRLSLFMFAVVVCSAFTLYIVLCFLFSRCFYQRLHPLNKTTTVYVFRIIDAICVNGSRIVWVCGHCTHLTGRINHEKAKRLCRKSRLLR